jgi:hypothetical protein
MTTPLPLACSLSATEFPQRLAEAAALGRDALVGVQQDAAHAELRFAAGNRIRERVEAFAAAESECCPFFTLRVSEEHDVVLLTVDAPADGASLLAELVEAFR